MRGGLPDWFKVSDEQIAPFRLNCLRVLSVCFGGLVLNDMASNSYMPSSILLITTAVPLALLAIGVSLIFPTVRLRLFWTLVPVAFGSLVLLDGYATWGSIVGAPFIDLVAILVGSIAVFALALMAFPEMEYLRKYKTLVYMSPDWKKAKV